MQSLSSWLSLESLLDTLSKNATDKILFTLTIFKILLYEGRSVLRPAQRVTRSEGVPIVSAENSKQDKKQLFKAISSFYAAVTSCMKLEKYQAYISHKT